MVAIAYTSDLHVDSSKENTSLVAHLVEAVEEAEPDLFLLAGDVGGGAAGLLGCLEAFGGLPVPKLFVPGNHDLWTEDPRGPFGRYRLDSATKHDSLLPALCEAAGWHYLPAEPFRIDGVGVAGVMGWYDYSLRNRSLDSRIPLEAYRRGRLGRLVWMDSMRVRWPRRPGREGWREKSACLADDVILERQIVTLKSHLESLKTQGAETIVAATHFLAGPEPIDYSGEPKLDFAYGFSGSRRLGGLLAKMSSVRALICGHTHRSYQGSSGPLAVFNSPVGRLGRLHRRLSCLKKGEGLSLKTLARQRLGLIRVEGRVVSSGS